MDDLLRPILRVAMPRAGRLYAPGGTVHVVARGNNREFCFTSSEDFELLVALLREMLRTYEVPLYAYTLGTPNPLIRGRRKLSGSSWQPTWPGKCRRRASENDEELLTWLADRLATWPLAGNQSKKH